MIDQRCINMSLLPKVIDQSFKLPMFLENEKINITC